LLELLVLSTSVRVCPQAIPERKVPDPLWIIGSHHVYDSDPVSRPAVFVHHEKLTAAGALVTAVDTAQRLKEPDHSVNGKRAGHPDGDVNDGLGGQAWNRR
jgi:hypothetical protein